MSNALLIRTTVRCEGARLTKGPRAADALRRDARRTARPAQSTDARHY
jgi:hypothetical protein